MKKYLWIVDMPNVQTTVAKAKQANVDGVFVRTTNINFHESIPAFHEASMEIHGWRFPPAVKNLAIGQAEHEVQLINLGLDGFVADPEDNKKPALNWDQSGLSGIAKAYCDIIVQALNGKPFGVTSHYLAAQVFPHLPWSTFLEHTGRVYPQSYWRVLDDNGQIKPVGHGAPVENFDKGEQAWAELGKAKENVLPMAGEIALATPEEIASYAKHAHETGKAEMHFYALGDANEPVPSFILDAIAAA